MHNKCPGVIPRHLLLVETTEIEPRSKYWIFNVSENPADSFADSAVGLSDIRLGRFPQNLNSFGESPRDSNSLPRCPVSLAITAFQLLERLFLQANFQTFQTIISISV